MALATKPYGFPEKLTHQLSNAILTLNYMIGKPKLTTESLHELHIKKFLTFQKVCSAIFYN